MGRGSVSTASDHGVPDEGRPSRLRRALEDDPWMGRVIDARYRIEGVLGTGGVGVVYRAEHTGLRQPVALKVLRHGYEDIEMLRRRFEREATILSQLRHPNVVSLSDYGISDGVPYLVMELLEGRTLEEMLDTEGPPSPREAVEIARSVARGLAFAHGMGVLHRDLKPGNVFLQHLPDDPHHVKLLDFGLAKILADDPQLEGEPTITKAGTVIGTPAYMAPEQGAGQRVDERADVYSVGVLLFELLTGCPPFESDRRADLLRMHMVTPVPDPQSLRPGLVLSSALESLLLRALAKEPSGRFRDGAELLKAFDQLPEGAARFETPDDVESTRPTHVPSLHDVHRQEAVAPRSKQLPVAIAVVVTLLLLGVVLVLSMGGEPPQDPQPDPTETEEAPTETQTGGSNAAGDGVEPPNPTPSLPTPPPGADPFDMPVTGELAELRDRLSAPESLDREAHLAMRIYQRLNPDDVRPSLLLAHDFADRGAWGPAIERYRVAIARSADARHDPRMLQDLLRAAQMERHASEAADAIVEIFGEAALPDVEEALARTESRPRRRKLRALLQRLRQPSGA